VIAIKPNAMIPAGTIAARQPNRVDETSNGRSTTW